MGRLIRPIKGFNDCRDGGFALLSVAKSKEEEGGCEREGEGGGRCQRGRGEGVNKVWSVRERRQMLQFGDEACISVPAATQDAFYVFVPTRHCSFKLSKLTFFRASQMPGRRELGGDRGCYGGGDDGGMGDDDGGMGDDDGKCEEDLCHKNINLRCVEKGKESRGGSKGERRSTFQLKRLPVYVNTLAQKPFLTCQDGWLVALTSDQAFHEGHFVGHMLWSYRLQQEGEEEKEKKKEEEEEDEMSGDKADRVVQVYPSSLRHSATAIKQILRLQRHPTSKDDVIVYFSNRPGVCCCGREEKVCEDREARECSCEIERPACYMPPSQQTFLPPQGLKTCYCTGMLVLNLHRTEVLLLIEDLLPPCTFLDRLILSRDLTHLYDCYSNVYDLRLEGAWRGVLRPTYPPDVRMPKSDNGRGGVEERFGWPTAVLLEDKALLYLRGELLTLVRLCDQGVMARVSVHSPVTAVAVSCDERTFYVGGLDGTVTSYVAVDVRKRRRKKKGGGCGGGGWGGGGGGSGGGGESDDLEAVIAKIESRREGKGCGRVWDVTGTYPEYHYLSGDTSIALAVGAGGGDDSSGGDLKDRQVLEGGNEMNKTQCPRNTTGFGFPALPQCCNSAPVLNCSGSSGCDDVPNYEDGGDMAGDMASDVGGNMAGDVGGGFQRPLLDFYKELGL